MRSILESFATGFIDGVENSPCLGSFMNSAKRLRYISPALLANLTISLLVGH